MKIIIQPTLSSCGPTSIVNIGFKRNLSLDLNEIKRMCKTDRNGTYDLHFEKTLSKFFKYNKKYYKKFSDLKKDLLKNDIILGYEYDLPNGEVEGHYITCSLKKNQVIGHNFYYNKDAHKINYKNRAKYLKKNLVLNEKEFKKYRNIVAYLIKKDSI